MSMFVPNAGSRLREHDIEIKKTACKVHYGNPDGGWWVGTLEYVAKWVSRSTASRRFKEETRGASA